VLIHSKVFGYMFRPHCGHLQANIYRFKCLQCACNMGTHNVYNCNVCNINTIITSGVPRGWFGGFKPPRNSEDIGGVLDRMSKKTRSLDFLLQFTVFSYGCNLLNKGFF